MSQASVLQTVIHPKSPSGPPTVRPLTMTPAAGLDDEVLGNDPNDLEAILGVLVENAPVAMAMFDRNMRYLLANRQWVSDFGLQQEMPLVGRSQFEVLPNLHPGWRSVYDRALQGHVVRNEHDVMQDPTGRPVIFRWEVRPWRRGKEAAVGGLMVTCEKFAPIVITQEAAPIETVSVTERIVQGPPIMVPDAAAGLQACELPVMVLDMDGVIQQANPAAERVATGPVQTGTTCFWEVVATATPTELPTQTITALANAMGSDGLAPASLVTMHPNSDGQRVIRWAITYAAPDNDEPRALLIGVIYDKVTPSPQPPVPLMPPPVLPFDTAEQIQATHLAERRKLEEQLKKAAGELSLLQDVEQAYKRRELRQREVLDTMPCGLLVLDERGCPVFHNAHVRDLFGRELKPGEAVEEWLAQACLNDTHREEITRIWRESVWRRQLTKIVSLSTSDGLLKDFELRPVGLPNDGLLVTIHDVTETSRLEEMLRSAEAKFRTVLHDSPVAVVLTDISGAIFEVNPSAERLFNHPRTELRRTSIDDWLGVDAVHARRTGFAKIASGGQSLVSTSAELILSAGAEPIPAVLRIAAIKDSEGRFHASALFFETIKDLPVAVTEIPPSPKKAVEPLQEVAPPVRTSTESWQPILLATNEGRILDWSEAAAALFGQSADAAKSRWLHQFFRPSDATGFSSELQDRLASPATSFEWTCYGAGGNRRVHSFRIRRASEDRIELLTSHAVAGAPSSATEQGHEVKVSATTLWPEVDLDRERLMLTETHHRIKNHLQLISSLLSLQGNNLGDGTAKQVLRSSQNRVRAIAALHNHLYQIALGQELGQQEFAEELVARLRDCHGIGAEQVSIDMNLPDFHPREEWVMPLALVLNEALSNCFKHAYPDGRRGRIEVRLATDGETAHLTIQDDGPGLPEDFEPGASLGLGLKVAGVFADQMKGKIHLKNIIPAGLFFDLQFPIGCVDN